MVANPLRDSSSNVYNSQWRSFASWANASGIVTKDLSYITLAEYLVHFNQNKQVNTIKVYRSAIANILKIFNPPTPFQEDTIHNLLHVMSIQRPRSQEILPKWHLSVVLEGLMKPPLYCRWISQGHFPGITVIQDCFPGSPSHRGQGIGVGSSFQG